MKNYVKQGHMLPFIGQAGGHLSGDLVIVGALFGISSGDVAEGTEGELAMGGVYKLPKVPGQAWANGVAIYWDPAAKLATTVAAGGTKIGTAHRAWDTGTTAGDVRLNDSF